MGESGLDPTWLHMKKFQTAGPTGTPKSWEFVSLVSFLFVFQISLAIETSVHLTMVAFCPPPEQQSLINHSGSESIQNEIFVFKYCTL
jgi:hypothetical protein